MARDQSNFSIDEGFEQIARTEMGRLPRRAEFHDPLVVSFAGVRLSALIDEQLERFYNPAGPVEMISRVFRRLRRA